MWLEPPDEPSSRDLTRVPTRCSWSMYGALYAQQIAQRGVRNAGAGASRAEVPGTTTSGSKGHCQIETVPVWWRSVLAMVAWCWDRSPVARGLA